jgi:predicted TIM-barrel fold metal-dependent hydrolase
VIEDVVVIDAVAHAYNLSAENAAGPTGAMVREGLYMLHAHWNPPDAQVPRALFQSDQPAEQMAAALFLESDTDLAVYHTLRLDSLFKDGMCSHAKNVEVGERWPQRFVGYAGVDPTRGLERCLADLEAQVSERPGLLGLKLYPDQVEPYRTWRMDDPELAFPLFARAQELGFRSIAVHKALPNGPVPLNPYRVDDVEGAAMAFPQLGFEIVHAGMAFVEETAHALARFPNVYASLEITTLLLRKAPGLFQDVLAQFLFWGGPMKILWSTGCLFGHPQPLLEAFWALELDEALLRRYGLPQLTREDKRLILGGNYARMMGLDLDAIAARVAGDEWARRRAAEGRPAPYATWTAAAGAEA